MFIREDTVLRETKIPYWFWNLFLGGSTLAIALSNFYLEILQVLELFWHPKSSSHHTFTNLTSELDNLVQKEAKELTPGTCGTGCAVCACCTPF